MNILFVCEQDPDRVEFGGQVRTHLIYEALRRIGTVRVLCADPAVPEVPGERRRMAFPSRGWLIRQINRVCWAIYEWNAPTCPKVLPFPYDVDIESFFPGERFDAIVVRYPHLAAITHIWRYGKTWIDVDDDPVQMYDTLVAPRQNRLRRWVVRRLLRGQVNRVLSWCAGGWISNAEQVRLFPPRLNVRALRNIPLPASSHYRPDAERRKVLLTIGGMSGAPNHLGVDEFIRTVWPRVRKAHPDLEYWIAGKGAPADFHDRWMRTDGVRCLGFVEDREGLYAQALATVVPIRHGGGTCIKTRESLVLSRVCLSTEFGARGISTEDRTGNGLLVYCTVDDFMMHLEKVLDETWRAAAEKDAKRYADENLSLEAFAKELEKSLESEDGGRVQYVHLPAGCRAVAEQAGVGTGD